LETITGTTAIELRDGQGLFRSEPTLAMERRIGIGRHRWENDSDCARAVRNRNAAMGCETDPLTGAPFIRFAMVPDADGKGGQHPELDPLHWWKLAQDGSEYARDVCKRKGIPWEWERGRFGRWRAGWIRDRMPHGEEQELAPWAE
jgi:hypothetical protein